MDYISKHDLASRLARTIASDIALYNADKIAQGMQEDSLFDLLAHEIAQGRELYRKRVAPEIFSRESFFEHALVDLIFYRS